MIRETTEQETAEKKISVSSAKRSTKAGQAHVQATYNNTIVSVADDHGNVLAWASAGALGFKGAKKATPYAATRVVETVMEKVKKSGLQDVVVYVKGIGSGRESAVRTIANALNVLSVSDVTPIPHNGCRPPKVRRV
ncbi:30S ribosomal protein S11 [Candidatus Azambacteria bacterium]|nr:30S ribosomal protein S11 [Candidatus Azambacteria bacterium]MBI3684803.1 30S ribosomal protein S11 [Candidatus Azambacteria bacterium]